MNSVANSVLKRIRVHGRGWVFMPRDFLALGTRRAVDRALARLTQDNTIRRLTQGLYDYPRVHKKLGILAPNPDDVAAVLGAKTGGRVQVSGARAANLLDVVAASSPRHMAPVAASLPRHGGVKPPLRQTTQVPAQLVYLTDGPAHRVKIGAQTIQLKPARPSRFPGAGTPAGLAAIRAERPRLDAN